MITDDERKALLAEYREIPRWMLTRDHTVEEIRELMDLRRRAFPKTKPER